MRGASVRSWAGALTMADELRLFLTAEAPAPQACPDKEAFLNDLVALLGRAEARPRPWQVWTPRALASVAIDELEPRPSAGKRHALAGAIEVAARLRPGAAATPRGESCAGRKEALCPAGARGQGARRRGPRYRGRRDRRTFPPAQERGRPSRPRGRGATAEGVQVRRSLAGAVAQASARNPLSTAPRPRRRRGSRALDRTARVDGLASEIAKLEKKGFVKLFIYADLRQWVPLGMEPARSDGRAEGEGLLSWNHWHLAIDACHSAGGGCEPRAQSRSPRSARYAIAAAATGQMAFVASLAHTRNCLKARSFRRLCSRLSSARRRRSP